MVGQFVLSEGETPFRGADLSGRVIFTFRISPSQYEVRG
jgi:hypothetical protein